MTTATAPRVRVASATVRMRPDQSFWWKSDYCWRAGPDTPDGFWMVKRFGYPDRDAVRLINDTEAPERTAVEFGRALADAVDAEAHDAEDQYLAALTAAAEIPPEDLMRLRDAVRAGKAGGSADGTAPKARRASRKAAAA